MSFIFGELVLPPLNKRFKICFKSFLSLFRGKTVSEVLKTSCFSYSAFWSADEGGWGAAIAFPGYATEYDARILSSFACFLA